MWKYEIINSLISKYNFTRYLEIGIFNGDNIEKIQAELKHGVDPGSERGSSRFVTHPLTSDMFFESIDNKFKYDIIFIDGLHYAEQTAKDIRNSLRHTVDNGYVILHDCIPLDYESQLIPRKTNIWMGDVWRALLGFRLSNQDIPSCVVDTDYGVGIIKNINGNFNDFQPSNITYEEFNSQKHDLLNIISVSNFKLNYL